MNLSTTHVIVGFSNIKTTRTNVCNLFQEIKQKLGDLNKMYMDIVKNHAIKEYTFGLDAFHFQSKLIEHEYENMQKLLNTITNRFYCEYYKLYKIIIEYVHNELKLNVNIASKTVFPVYKDLDKNINYDFNLTVEIQAICVKYINALNDYLLTKNKELNINNNRQSKCGINIEHIVHYQSYTNALIAEQIRMFIRYMDALNKHHTKYINRLYKISKNLLDDVNADITTSGLDFEQEQEQENEYEVISMNERASPLPIAFMSTQYEPTKFEPTKFEPTKFEPTKFEPTKFEPTKFEPTKFEPTKFEPTQFEPTKFEPTQFEPTKFEPTQYVPNAIYAIPAKRALPVVSSPVLSRSPSVISKISQIVKPVEEIPVMNECVNVIEEPVNAIEEPLVTIEAAVIAFEDSLVVSKELVVVDDTFTIYDTISNSTNASDVINEENIVMTIV